MATMVISGGCQHAEWTARAALDREQQPWAVVVEMTCVECFTPMIWESAATSDPNKVAVAIRLPCRPFSVQPS